MKKLILPFVALLLCMVACQKEDLNLLTLEVEHFASDAKMHIDEWDFAVWDDGDTVWLNENPRRVTVDNANHRATISAQDIYSSYYASYPYVTRETGTSVAKSYTISLPEVQEYEEVDGRQKVASPMFAFGTNDNPTLKFRNIGSVLAVKVLNNTYGPIQVYSISVTSDDQNLWGENSFRVADINDDLALNSLINGGRTVTLMCDGGVEVPAEGKVFYIALPTISNTHLTIKVDDGYGIYTRAQTNNTATFNRNTLHQVPFSASDDICESYAARPNIIKYTATSKLDGFEANTSVWGKTVLLHDYNEISGKGTISFSSDITEIPERAFYERVTLLSIILPESVEAIRRFAFYCCNSLASVSMPESVETIERYSFYWCSSLHSVSMPSVTSVGQWAFAYCNALTTLNLPSVTMIEEKAFYKSGIQTITFGPNLSELGLELFASCTNITDIYCKAQTPPSCASDLLREAHSFTNMNCSPALHVPAGKADAYTRTFPWTHFSRNTSEDCPTD